MNAISECSNKSSTLARLTLLFQVNLTYSFFSPHLLCVLLKEAKQAWLAFVKMIKSFSFQLFTFFSKNAFGHCSNHQLLQKQSRADLIPLKMIWRIVWFQRFLLSRLNTDYPFLICSKTWRHKRTGRIHS